jgi:hypothetical protein
MGINQIRLFMAIFFLVMSIGLFARRWFVSEEVLRQYSESRLDLSAAFALLLCGWNAVRWYAARSEIRRRQELHDLKQRRVEQNPDEYNPEFDFSEQPPK